MELELFLDALLECGSLFEGERVGLGDDGNDVDDVRELLQHDNVDWLEGVPGWLDEEETAVYSRVLDISLSLCCELFPQVR